MTRIASYSRYSTDLQSDRSIVDQQRLCETLIPGAGAIRHFEDAALSGASLIGRPGIQALLRAARGREFDLLLCESLDRLSRDQADIATIYKVLKFAGIRLVTFAEGEIDEMKIGFNGTMNALFLNDLRQKTRRGLRGRVEAGQSAGGRAYGYRVVAGRRVRDRSDRSAAGAADLPMVRLRDFTEGHREASERGRCAWPRGRGVESEHDPRAHQSGHRHSEQRVVCRPSRLESTAVSEGSGHRQAGIAAESARGVAHEGRAGVADT
jgi:site-specific DNA recombinase